MTSGARTTLRVIAIAALIFFLVGLLFAVPPFIEQLKVLRNWPSTDAVVVRSQVVSLTTASGEKLYDSVLTLSYEIGGRPYLREVGSIHQSTSYERKRKQAERFPAGSRIPIRYNPRDPDDIRIQAGFNRHFFAVPIFIAGASSIFGVLALVVWLVSRRGEAQASAA